MVIILWGLGDKTLTAKAFLHLCHSFCGSNHSWYCQVNIAKIVHQTHPTIILHSSFTQDHLAERKKKQKTKTKRFLYLTLMLTLYLHFWVMTWA